jgi:hypothetical protein
MAPGRRVRKGKETVAIGPVRGFDIIHEENILATSRLIRLLVAQSAVLAFCLVNALSQNGPAQQPPDFSGNWVLRLGERIVLVATFAPSAGNTALFTGTLLRPEHFTVDSHGAFSKIKGSTISYSIVRSTIQNNCLSFTVQNPADKHDEDQFQLCITEPMRGTLKVDVPGFEPWPVIREKGATTIATDWDEKKTYYVDEGNISNSEMQQIFEEDQRVRQPGTGKIAWKVVNKSDADRREATAKLLAADKLHTGEDFERAAFIFQHGATSDDYLLAHALAMVAVSRGQRSALWIAAATMDRYLNSVHQPQIYGTQFFFNPNGTTQEPYNRTLIPDSLRRFLNVPAQAAQEEQRKQYELERSKQ